MQRGRAEQARGGGAGRGAWPATRAARDLAAGPAHGRRAGGAGPAGGRRGGLRPAVRPAGGGRARRGLLRLVGRAAHAHRGGGRRARAPARCCALLRLVLVPAAVAARRRACSGWGAAPARGRRPPRWRHRPPRRWPRALRRGCSQRHPRWRRSGWPTWPRSAAITYLLSEAQRTPVARGSALPAGAGLVTVGPGSRAVVAFADRTRLTLEGDTVLAQLAEPAGAGGQGGLPVARAAVGRGAARADRPAPAGHHAPRRGQHAGGQASRSTSTPPAPGWTSTGARLAGPAGGRGPHRGGRRAVRPGRRARRHPGHPDVARRRRPAGGGHPQPLAGRRAGEEAARGARASRCRSSGAGRPGARICGARASSSSPRPRRRAT